MTNSKRSKAQWLLIRFPVQLLYRIGLGPLIGRMILLLTTTGRRTGLPRVVPLQYEALDGVIYVASALGQEADWFRNIVANPEVTVRLKSRQFRGEAKPITDPVGIADFLELRLRRHPRIVGAIMRRAGLPSNPARSDLEEYAERRAVVAIQPVEANEKMSMSTQ